MDFMDFLVFLWKVFRGKTGRVITQTQDIARKVVREVGKDPNIPPEEKRREAFEGIKREAEASGKEVADHAVNLAIELAVAETKGKYEVKIYKGDYRDRQRQANKDKAICYYEQHFNAATPKAHGTEVLVAHNASEKSRRWAKLLAKNFSQELGTVLRRDEGLYQLKVKDRGNGNLRWTDMPACLGEPLFVSNPKEAELLRENIETIAKCVSSSINESFPDGGLVALSIGHKYKSSNPNDRGANVVGGGTEADYAEEVILKAKEILEKEEVQVVN